MVSILTREWIDVGCLIEGSLRRIYAFILLFRGMVEELPYFLRRPSVDRRYGATVLLLLVI